MRHLLSMEDLDRVAIERIIDRARSFTEVSEREIKKVPALRGRRVLNLFYEASTRTRSSFELAAKALSADVVNFAAGAPRWRRASRSRTRCRRSPPTGPT
jgi:aspartate carbamoyltransferase catalytic subunit